MEFMKDFLKLSKAPHMMLMNRHFEFDEIL